MTTDERYKKKCEMLVKEVQQWIGTKESGGDNRGKEIEEFQRAVDGKASNESWCLSFVMYCVKKVDSEFERQFGGVNEPSWLKNTEHVMTLWNETTLYARLKEVPHPGCLILWQYYSSGKQTSRGHVGVVTQVIDTEYVESCEGNTSQSGEVERNGDGVYRKYRRIAGGSSMKVKGFLKCWSNE